MRDRQTDKDRQTKDTSKDYHRMTENTNENWVTFYEGISTDILAQASISLLSTVEVERALEHRLKFLKQTTTQIHNRKILDKQFIPQVTKN